MIIQLDAPGTDEEERTSCTGQKLCTPHDAYEAARSNELLTIMLDF